MAGPVTAAVITGAATAYAANRQKKAAEEAAKGGKVTPWGPTGPYMEEILSGAMDRFREGGFQFGPSPSIYNAYLGFGRGNLGLDIPKRANLDPDAYSYGPQAYQYMLDMMMGPGFQGAQRGQPQYLMQAQDPWVSGALGALGGYTSFQGLGGGSTASHVPGGANYGYGAGTGVPGRVPHGRLGPPT